LPARGTGQVKVEGPAGPPAAGRIEGGLVVVVGRHQPDRWARAARVLMGGRGGGSARAWSIKKAALVAGT